MFLKNTLILRPHKLIELMKKVIYNNNLENENDDGILDERTFENLCQPFIEQKQTLLALLKKFDLLCERILSTTTICKQYYVPSCIRRIYNEKIIIEKDEQSVVFYYLFDGYFPGNIRKNLLGRIFWAFAFFLESLFHQILVRTIKWTQSNHVSSPKLYYRRGKFIVDDQHLLILTASSMKYARMKVQIIRNNPNATNPTAIPPPPLPPPTTNSANNKPQDELNPQLADPAVVAKVSCCFF
jgi:hypothetical protein